MHDITTDRGSDPAAPTSDVCQEPQFITLHVVTKNLQSIRNNDRFIDFLLELDRFDFDLLCLSETWRNEREEILETPGRHRVFLSGGSGHCGVGICISYRLLQTCDDLVFHALGERICSLSFRVGRKRFVLFACYFPTSWAMDDEVEHVYALLRLLLGNAVQDGQIPLLGGDFNACIGEAEEFEPVEFVGPCGMGDRNDRGNALIEFVLNEGLCIFNRHMDMSNVRDSWTCSRSSDGKLVQIDFVLGGLQFLLDDVWYDFGFPIGLDHRCVHCKVRCFAGPRESFKKHPRIKGWKPHFDDDMLPTKFQNAVSAARTCCPDLTFASLEHVLRHSAVDGGQIQRDRIKFQQSPGLSSLRRRRRTTEDPDTRRLLSLEIRKRQRLEIQIWKTEQVNRRLAQITDWKYLKDIDAKISGSFLVQKPPVDEFAQFLGALFAGGVDVPLPSPSMSEPPWSMEDLRHALRRMKADRCDDDAGLVAELVQFSPNHVLQDLLRLYNETLFSGEVPETWKLTTFMMLPKSRHARVPADYRPIASVRLLYKIFAYMMLARVEPALEIHQPEEQHGFRKGHRIEEHLLTANLVVDKLLAVSTPIWIISLDLSKAFDRVSWDKLWVALRLQGISDHLVWTMQNLYTGQLGQIQGDAGDNRVFPIRAGVRQGCVLSPRLFTAILQWAMQKWRQRVENSACGIDLKDGDSKLLDLRFADDILLFARTKAEAIFMLETLMEELACVGLCLNASKTVVLTNEAQPPSCLILTNQEAIVVKANNVGHKWLGCILSAGADGRSTLDITFHLQAASRAFFANKQILCDKKVRLAVRLRFFDRVITPVALFASGHRTIRMSDLYKLDVAFRKMLRMIVGPPNFVEWNAPWHDILHHWNGKAVALAQPHGLKSWSEQCLKQHWKFAMHVANLPPNRWVKRVLLWNPNGARKPGYPRHDWTSKLVAYMRFQQLGEFGKCSHRIGRYGCS